MPMGVVVWNHAIYTRHLPRGIELKPGRNTVPTAEWEEVKDIPRVRALLEAGSEGGISLSDLRNDIAAKIEAGSGIDAVNELPIEEAVAWVFGEEDTTKLKALQAKVRFPQVAVAIQQRLKELTKSHGGRKRKVEA